MAKSVGLLTLPLHTNYGGILQVVALYQFLAANGKQPVLLRKKPARSRLHRFAAALLQHVPGQDIGRARSNEKARALHYPFIKAFMPEATVELRTSKDFRKATDRHKLDAVIVGSDQVWRFEYHADREPLIYFLDFVDPGRVRAISYAASFGQSNWRYPELTHRARELLAKFHAVSVREDSGVAICRDTLGRGDCIVTIDPTLLVDPSFYDKAVARQPVYAGRRIVSYVLDQSPTAQATGRVVTDTLGGHIGTVSLLPAGGGQKFDIPQWLRAIRDAEFVVTDSFHGTVFCILFGKNFIAIPNVERGVDRFTTLLDNVGLSDRLLSSGDAGDIPAIVNTPIDYLAVHERLAELRRRSAEFLLSALD